MRKKIVSVFIAGCMMLQSPLTIMAEQEDFINVTSLEADLFEDSKIEDDLDIPDVIIEQKDVTSLEEDLFEDSEIEEDLDVPDDIIEQQEMSDTTIPSDLETESTPVFLSESYDNILLLDDNDFEENAETGEDLVVFDNEIIETPQFDAAIKETGNWGENIQWAYDVEGTLYFYGNGEMADRENPAWMTSGSVSTMINNPWGDLLNSTRKVVIGDGITSVGKYVFCYMRNLKTVLLPSTVRTIGENAFWECEGLQEINLPDELEKIGAFAFAHCNTLIINEQLPGTLQEIGMSGFTANTYMTSIVVPGTVKEINKYTFSWCTSLEHVVLQDGIEKIGGQAFSHNVNMTIEIPNSVIDIAEDAFSPGDDNLIIKGMSGSYAEQYAAENGITFAEVEIIAHVHDWDDGTVTIKPGCFSEGIKTYKCKECDETKSESVPATGHDFGEWKTEKAATALAKGRKSQTCKKCGEKCYRDIDKLKAKVTLNKKSISLKKAGAKEKLSVSKKTYGDAVSKWISSNTKIAVISQKGVVTAKKNGKCTITVLMKSGVKASCSVTVKIPSSKKDSTKTKVKLNKTKATLLVGEKLTLKLTGAKGKVTWKSTKNKYATVSSKGVVKAKKKGSVTIKATNKGKTYKCTITVESPKLSTGSITIYTGKTASLKVSGTKQNIKWSSENSSVATVSQQGIVKGVNAGSTVIVAKINTKTFRCKVTVKEELKGYFENGQSVSGGIKEALGNLRSEEGYINPEDTAIAAEKVVSYARKAKDDGLILDYYYAQTWGTVTFIFPDGTSMFYAPAYEGTMSNGISNEFGVLAVDNVGNGVAHPSSSASTCISGIENEENYEGYALNENDSVSDLIYYMSEADSFRVIFWRGHGSSPILVKNASLGVDYVATAFKIPGKADDIRNDIDLMKDAKDCRFTFNDSGSVFVTPLFFDKYLKEVEGGLFYCGACYAAADNGNMAQAFLRKGFDAFIGADRSVDDIYSGDMMKRFANNLCKKDENGDYITALEALKEAKSGIHHIDYMEIYNLYLMAASIEYYGSGMSDFRLVPKQYSLIGTVYDEKDQSLIEDANIVIQNTRYSWAETCEGVSGDDGSFDISDVTSGDLKIVISKPGYIDKTISVDTKEYDATLEKTIDLGSILLTRDNCIYGKVVDKKDGNTPLQGVTVSLTIEGRRRETTTDAEGAFSFSHLPEGTATLNLIKRNYETLNYTIPSKIEGHCILLPLQMQRRKSKISGTVVTKADGTPIQGASISIKNESESAYSYSTSTDATGSYSIEFDSIDTAYWTVSASKEGYESNSTRVLVTDNEVTAASIALSKSETEVVDMEIWDGTVAKVYHGGTGTQNDPYQIANGAELALLAEQVNNGDNKAGTYFILTEDIYLNDASKHKDVVFQGDLYWKDRWDIPSEALTWTPIGIFDDDRLPFSGVFNGNGHAILGMYIWPWASLDGVPSSTGTGVFGLVENGTVKNLIVKDSLISGDKYVGGICGVATDSIISGCTYTGDSRGSECVGGIVGSASSSSITNCKMITKAGLVNGGNNFGGIVGSITYSTVSGCICESYLLSSGTPCGGIVGFMGGSPCQVTNNTSAGILYHIGSDKIRLGSIAGMKYEGSLSGNKSDGFICYTKITDTDKTEYSCEQVGSEL